MVNGFGGSGSGGGEGQLDSQSTQLQAGISGWRKNTVNSQPLSNLKLSLWLNALPGNQPHLHMMWLTEPHLLQTITSSWRFKLHANSTLNLELTYIYTCKNNIHRNYFTYLGSRENYCIFKTCSIISVLFSTKWCLFYSFIFFCSNNMFSINPVILRLWCYCCYGNSKMFSKTVHSGTHKIYTQPMHNHILIWYYHQDYHTNIHKPLN